MGIIRLGLHYLFDISVRLGSSSETKWTVSGRSVYSSNATNWINEFKNYNGNINGNGYNVRGFANPTTNRIVICDEYPLSTTTRKGSSAINERKTCAAEAPLNLPLISILVLSWGATAETKWTTGGRSVHSTNVNNWISEYAIESNINGNGYMVRGFANSITIL